jgi:hypothetical protein
LIAASRSWYSLCHEAPRPGTDGVPQALGLAGGAAEGAGAAAGRGTVGCCVATGRGLDWTGPEFPGLTAPADVWAALGCWRGPIRSLTAAAACSRCSTDWFLAASLVRNGPRLAGERGGAAWEF